MRQAKDVRQQRRYAAGRIAEVGDGSRKKHKKCGHGAHCGTVVRANVGASSQGGESEREGREWYSETKRTFRGRSEETGDDGYDITKRHRCVQHHPRRHSREKKKKKKKRG